MKDSEGLEYNKYGNDQESWSNRGTLGMVPEKAKKQDAVCILAGCSIPVILRRYGDPDKFEFVGECYLQGYMNGEAVDELEREGGQFQETQIA
jgi:hypothetical protein